MGAVLKFLSDYYSIYTMLMVVGSGLVSYLLDHREMLKKDRQREAKISKYIGLIYIYGGILLFIIVSFIG
jgi:hypothetical protein